jgi:adenylate kinase family enzyme
MKQIYLKVFCMLVKVFILGLPGSGKSLASRFLMSLLRERGQGTSRFRDYDILFKMFQQDIEREKFKAADPNGFDVIDPKVLDIALQKLEKKVDTYMKSVLSHEFILIEFARDNYRHALNQFAGNFLRDTYFLFIQANIDTCRSRLRERVVRPTSLDDHYVSTYTFDTFYRHDDIEHTIAYLKNHEGINHKRIKIIGNNSSLANLETELEQFVDSILLDLMFK